MQWLSLRLVSTISVAIFLAACSSAPKEIKNNSYVKGGIVKGSLSSSQKSEVAMVAFSILNTKYNWGGKKPDFGLDCSGLVSYVFKKSIGFELNGAARHMAQKGSTVPLSHVNGKLEPGDLLFFNTTGKSFSHVGIYIGEDKFLHASSGKKQVIISSVNNKYYQSRLERIKRL